MKLGFLIVCLLMSCMVNAREVIVWFLSAPKVSYVDLLDRPITSRCLTAQNNLASGFECAPMGDGCFHPQLGYIADEDDKKKKKKEHKEKELKTFNSEAVNMIHCDRNEYFDMFCGKAKPQKKKSGTEIWVDISTSLRAIDYSKDEIYCDRRNVVEKIQESCNVDIFLFNTSKKEAGSTKQICQSYGTNDSKRMAKWLKDSNADRILIITDVDEFHGEFADYLDQINATIKGIGVKPMTAKDMYKELEVFTKECKK